MRFAAAMRSTLRLTVVGAWSHILHLSRSPLDMTIALLTPLAYATLGFYLFRAGTADRPGSLLQAAVGAGLMGIWDSVLYGAGAAIQIQRRLGTLEVLVMAPAPLALSLMHITLAAAVVGTYSMAATISWGVLVFGVPLSFDHPALFAVSLAVCVLSLGMVGMLLASTFVLLRNANALTNALDFPIYLLSGILVPITVLPDWARPVSAVLPTTWAARAVQAAAGTADAGTVLRSAGMGLALAAAYLVIAVAMLIRVERRARSAATLALV